jgi:tetratricopeptide (TPR) repeat protein
MEPNSQPLISLCMIVKNEARDLERCLSSAALHVDEIIVVDTGSTDQTVAIAQQFGAKISYFEWCNDFAAARNASLAQATGQWILVLDGDEELVVATDLRQLLQDHSELNVYDLLRSELSSEKEMNSSWKISTWIRRLFRNLPGLAFVGRLHENIKYAQQEEKSRAQMDATLCHILHYGYRPELKGEKMINRNIPILELMRQEGEMPLLQLTTLADHYEVAGEKEKAQDCYREGFDRLLPHLLIGEKPKKAGYVRFLMYKLARQTLDAEDYDTAQLILRNGLAWFPDYPPLNYASGLLLFFLGFTRGAIQYFNICLQMGEDDSYTKAEPFNRRYIHAHPAFSLGFSRMQLGEWQQAATAFNLCLSFDPEYEPARQRLAEIVQYL